MLNLNLVGVDEAGRGAFAGPLVVFFFRLQILPRLYKGLKKDKRSK
jgi:ribonuclease HII